jgi:hypothetical protein
VAGAGQGELSVDSRTFRLFAGALVLVVALTGAVAFVAGGTAPDPDAPNGEQAVGVVVAIDSEGLDRVSGFTLREAGGLLVEFTIGQLENGVEFPPGHLVEHQTTAQQIRVWYREEDGILVAFRLEDAE